MAGSCGTSETMPTKSKVATLGAADAFLAATGVTIIERGDKAFYDLSMDAITMPERRRFKDTKDARATERFYSTLAHETIHWTGQETRCGREFASRFGDKAYAFEELVAELGAAFLCCDLGIRAAPSATNVSYLKHWLDIMKADKRAIFTAASKASEAVKFLHCLQPKPAATSTRRRVKATGKRR